MATGLRRDGAKTSEMTYASTGDTAPIGFVAFPANPDGGFGRLPNEYLEPPGATPVRDGPPATGPGTGLPPPAVFPPPPKTLRTSSRLFLGRLMPAPEGGRIGADFDSGC